jgi:hypothetical protein
LLVCTTIAWFLRDYECMVEFSTSLKIIPFKETMITVEKSNQQMHCTYLFNFLLCFSPTCFGVARRHPQGVVYN